MTRVRWENPEMVAAFRKFDWKRGKQDEPELQENPGPMHAYRQFPGVYPSVNFKVKEPVFLDGIGAGVPAVCGLNVRVLLSYKFNGADPDACPKCVKILEENGDTMFAPSPKLG